MTVMEIKIIATTFQIRRLRLFFSANSVFSCSNFCAMIFLSSDGSTVSPRSVLTVVSKISAILIRRSASGTERPFSHLDIVWRTTCNRSASSS